MDLSELRGSGRAPKVGLAAGLLVVAIAIFFFTHSGGEATGIAAREQAKAFYTVDDGKTWFADLASLVPPYDRAGKQAVQAMVYSDDGGKTPFVGYLFRYDAATKKKIEADPTAPRMGIVGAEVRKPGQNGTWISRNSRAGIEATIVTSPRGSKDVEQVMP